MLKKTIANLLCAPFIGRFLVSIFDRKVPSLRNPGYRFFVPVQYSSASTHASIFWGIYESAEIRLIRKHLRPDLPVIELGGSLGIVSSFIVRHLGQEASLKVVEANPNLIHNIRENLKEHNRVGVECEVFNNAIGYGDEYVYMQLSNDNTASHVSKEGSLEKDLVRVRSVRLSDLVGSSFYVLVCDIEGSEIDIIINEKEKLMQCRQLFIELHDAEYNSVSYKSEELVGLLENRGFICKEKDGNVYFFERQ